MSRTARLPSRRNVAAGLRRLLAVLVAGVLTLTLAGSGGAVQPAPRAVAQTPLPAAAGSSPAALATTGGAAPSPAPSSSPVPAAPNATPGIVWSGPPTDLPLTVHGAGPVPLPVARLQARLDAIRVKYRLPGVSATIIWPDGRSWTGVSGWADVGHHVKVVSGTAFSIGSVSKTFMATLVMQLVQEHKLSLDDTVRHWLPTARVSTKVTIRELLDHTSGLFDFFENSRIDPALLAHPAQVWSAALALSYMKAPYCAPGTCWAYSNSNYVLLGQVVEAATGNTPTQELRERFFDPLGLGRTFVQGVEPRRGTVATAYKLIGSVAGRRRISLADGTGISPFTSVVTAAGTAGDIASSSLDLATWARALYGGKILEPQSLAQMLDTSVSKRLHAPTPYGFAVSKLTLGGRLTYGHNGRLVGSRASIRYLPASGFTVAVVTNQDIIGPDVFGTSLVNIAIAALPPPPPIPPGGPPAPARSPSPSPSASPAGTGPTPTPTLAPPPALYPPD